MKRIFLCMTMLLMPVTVFCGQFPVKADQLEASVYYDLASRNGEIVRIRVQYNDTTPISEVYDVGCYPREQKPDGEYAYFCSSIEGIDVIFRFEVRKARFRKAQVDTNYRPKEKTGEEQKIMTLQSIKGFKIVFTFSFKDGQIVNVNIKPSVNPFS